MRWVKCRSIEGTDVYVNLDEAITMRWSEKDKRTFIAFPGVKDYFTVREQPDNLIEQAKYLGG